MSTGTIKRPVWKPVILFFFFIGLPLLVHWMIDSLEHLSGDLSELIPQEDHSREVVEARGRVQAHFTEVLLVSVPVAPTGDQREAVRRVLDPFKETGRIGRYWMRGEPVYDAVFVGEAGQWIWPLFFPRWVDRRLQDLEMPSSAADFNERLATMAAERLDAYLDDPVAGVAAEWIPSDPLLLLPETLETMQGHGGWVRENETGDLIIWIPAGANPFSPKGQRELTALSEELRERFQETFPESEIAVQGIHLPAMESESGIRAEVVRLNVGAGILVLLILIFAFRSPCRIVIILLPVLAGALWGGVMTLLVFGEIHLLALAISSVLIGVGIDYSLHLFTRAAETQSPGIANTFAEIRRPLLIGAGSSALGFAFLLFSPITAIQQVGILLPVGVLVALATCRLLVPALTGSGGVLPPFMRMAAQFKLPVSWRKGIRWILLPAAAVSLGSLFLFPHYNDDIDAFQLPPGEAARAYESARERVTGESPEGTLWMTFAPSTETLFARLETAIEAGAQPLLWEIIRHPSSDPAVTRLKGEGDEFSTALAEALEEHSFDATAFSGALKVIKEFDERLSEENFDRALRVLANSLRGPAGVLLMESDELLLTVYPVDAEQGGTPPAGSIRLGERERIETALRTARTNITIWIMAGFGALVLLFGLLFGIRGSAILCLLPLLAVSVPLALLSLTGGISLLALLGAILGFCLALDYAAFGIEGPDGPILSVRLSGLTTAVAFGVLSLSAIPALSQLGLVVSLTVIIAVLATEVFVSPSPESP